MAIYSFQYDLMICINIANNYFRYEAIIPGKPEFIAEYTDKYWYCESEEMLLKFMK